MTQPIVAPPGVAKRNAAISVIIGFSLLAVATFIVLYADYESRQAVIGGAAMTGLTMYAGVIFIGCMAMGVIILAFTFLFWIGWKHDYNKLLKQRPR